MSTGDLSHGTTGARWGMAAIEQSEARGIPPMAARDWVLTTAFTAGLVGLALVGLFGSLLLVAVLPLAPLCALLAVIDVRCHRLPNVLVLPGIAGEAVLLGVVAGVGGDAGLLLRAACWSGGVFVGGALIASVAPGALGFGDVKLAALLALPAGALGAGTVAGWLFVTFVTAGIVAIGLILAGRANRRTRVAFGPYLIAGLFVALALA